jgi:hypothetical protein
MGALAGLGLGALALVVGLAAGLGQSGSAAAASSSPSPSSSSAPTLENIIATVYLHPSNLPTVTPCDPSISADMGCNVWWGRDDAWAAYVAQRSTDWALLSSSVGGGGGGGGSGSGGHRPSAIIYFPAFLADAAGGRGTAPLDRLATVVADCAAAGLEPILFFGRPEFFGFGNASQSRDVVRVPANRAYLLGLLGAALALPAVQQHVGFVSLYWLGASWFCAGASPSTRCTEDEIANFTADVKARVEGGESGGGGGGGGGGGSFTYLQHLDGPFWDACWPQPCPVWNISGYSPSSLAASGVQGLLAESWVQGSLLGGVKRLLAEGVVAPDRLLLLTDVPNCDLYPSTHPCSTGTLAGDVAAWFGILDETGIANGTWGVWAGLDGGLQDDANFYGDLLANATGLTLKGQLHRARALQDAAAAAARDEGGGGGWL